MAEYASAQPSGFQNHVKNIAIVGVSIYYVVPHVIIQLILIGWRKTWFSAG